jgi:DNA repair protein RecN (Recombination protein N)
VSNIQPVQGVARVAEIARMLGGESLSGTAHAQALLGHHQAKNKKTGTDEGTGENTGGSTGRSTGKSTGEKQ